MEFLHRFHKKKKGGGGGGGGGGGVAEVFPMVGLFVYLTITRSTSRDTKNFWRFPLVATLHPLGSYSASVH